MKNRRLSKSFLIFCMLSLSFPFLSYAQTPTPSPTITPSATPTPYYFVWPRSDLRMISTLGSLRVAASPTANHLHSGIDLKNCDGQAVYPSAEGTIRTKRFLNGPGFHVTVEHDNGMITNYLHLLVDDPPQFPGLGESVSRSDQIGQVGGTGGGYPSHLHFEIREVRPGATPNYDGRGDAHNPLNYLPPPWTPIPENTPRLTTTIPHGSFHPSRQRSEQSLGADSGATWFLFYSASQSSRRRPDSFQSGNDANA